MDFAFLGEIRWFAFNAIPDPYLRCEGQLLGIEQHMALFTLLGTTYGGDGITWFALPDLRGRAMLNHGQGVLMTPREPGDFGGSEAVALVAAEMPVHTHEMRASVATANDTSPVDTLPAVAHDLYTREGAPVSMRANPLAGQAHDNMPPALYLVPCIAISGFYPVRS